jgi:hypothetical protein
VGTGFGGIRVKLSGDVQERRERKRGKARKKQRRGGMPERGNRIFAANYYLQNILTWNLQHME